MRSGWGRRPGRWSVCLSLALTASLLTLPRTTIACAAPFTLLPERESTGSRPIILVGLDAADWLAIDPLVRAGRLPTFARLKSAGHTGTLLSTPPLISPIIWTTIATGREPEDHGVLDFMVDLPSGGQAPVSVTSRRVPALWNMFSDGGKRVGIVGWWATWPAEAVHGTIVSDRLAMPLWDAAASLDSQAIAPTTEKDRLAALLIRPDALKLGDLTRYLPLTQRELDRARTLPRADPARLYQNPVAHLTAVVATTRSYAAMTRALLNQRPPDLLAVYLEGIDTISHLFIRDPKRGPQAIAAAYADADTLLAQLATAAPPRSWILVCSDHGFQPADAAITEDPADLTGPATAWHRPYGMVAAIEARDLIGSTAPAAAPRQAGMVKPIDIAPTVLHAAGLPVDSQMPGRIVTELLPDEEAARPVVRRAMPNRPQQPAVTAASPSRVDAEVQARLRALGYIGTQPTSLARQNLGEILYRKGRFTAAERELRAVTESQPQNLTAQLWLAKTLRDSGRPDQAWLVYQRALRLPGGMRDGVIEAVETAIVANRRDEAGKLLASLRPSAGDTAAVHTAHAVLAQADGRRDGARHALEAALAADPVGYQALSRWLDIAISAQRPRDALQRIQAAATRAAGSARHQALLGEALLAAGEAVAAEAALARASALAPDSAAVRQDLGRAQLAQKRFDRALLTFADLPASPERSILMGAAFSGQGRYREAADRYREALAVRNATPELLNGLAWAELKQGHTREAAELLDRSLALRKDQPEIARLRDQIGDGRKER